MVYGREGYSYAKSCTIKISECMDNYCNGMVQHLFRDLMTTCGIDDIDLLHFAGLEDCTLY